MKPLCAHCGQPIVLVFGTWCHDRDPMAEPLANLPVCATTDKVARPSRLTH